MSATSKLFMAFISGGVLMALEFAASRLLAPFFGSSIYVWGSLIGVIMSALALGYFMGGWLIDRNPSEGLLHKIIFLSAILIAIIPIHSFILLPLFSGLGLIYGSLVSTMIIFGPPMILLAMVAPMVIRLQAVNKEEVGVTSGSVYAISTVGSIFGIFISVFLMIPDFGTQKTILALSIVLFLMSASRIKNVSAMTFMLVLIVGFLMPKTMYALVPAMIYSAESEYHSIHVFREENKILLMSNYVGGAQTVSYDNQTLTGAYYDYFNLGPVLNKKSNANVLFIGMGGGTSIKQLLHFFNVTIDAVEIDSKIVDVAREYFGITDSERLRIHVGDGRVFIKDNSNYDIVCLDTFIGFQIPPHLATKEFFMDVKESLNDDGIVMMNVVSINDTRLLNSTANTLHSVFPSVYSLKIDWGNTILIAFNNKTEIDDMNFDYPDVELAGILNKSRDSIVKFDKTNDLIFTDDKTNIERISFDMVNTWLESQ